MVKTTIVILAAGLGSRMNGEKMLVPFMGKPMVLRCVESALASNADEIIVVLGHDSQKIIEAINSTVIASEREAIQFIHSIDYKMGLSASLKTGINAVKTDAALIMLGDMPLISTSLLNHLMNELKTESDIIVPTHKGEMGNPMVWGKTHFPLFQSLAGDRGAKTLLLQVNYKQIEVNDTSILKDFDTPQDLENLKI